jgi:hypothetical protein
VLMGANGKGLIETFKFITSNQTRWRWGTQLFKKGGVTYVVWL